MKYIITLFFLLFFTQIHAQRWEHIYEETHNKLSHISCVRKTYDNGYLMFRKSPKYQYVLIKTDINGEILWSKRIFNEENNYFFGTYIDVTESGMIYIAGAVKCGDDNYCSHVMCLDKCGELVWSKYFDLNVYNYAMHIFGYNDGSAIIHTRYAGLYNGVVPQERAQLIKLNKNGNIEWINHIVPEYEYDDIYEVDFENVQKSDDGFLLTGRCWVFQPPNLLWLKGIIVETDEFGNEIYVDYYNHDYVDSINGELLYTKEYEDYYLTTGYESFYDSGVQRGAAIIGKVNKENGEIITHVCNGLDSIVHTDWGSHIIDCPIGLYLVKAIFRYGIQGGTLQFDKLDNNLLASDSIIDYWNTNVNDQCAHFVEEDSSFLFSGWHRSDSIDLYPYDAAAFKIKSNFTWDSLTIDTNIYDSLCLYPIDSGNVTYSAEPFIIVGINEENRITKKELLGLSVYPNPANNNITFSTKVISEHRYVEIYNISGVLIDKIQIQRNINQVSFDSSNVTPGLYIAKLIIEGQTVDVTKFIIQ